jgi:hypothetical protein
MNPVMRCTAMWGKSIISVITACWFCTMVFGTNRLITITKEVETRARGGGWVKTQVTISDGTPARIEGTIRVLKEGFLEGFPADAWILFKDDRGSIIYQVAASSLGVNAVVWESNKGTKAFSQPLPDVVRDKVRNLEIQHLEGEIDRVANARQNREPVEESSKQLGQH